MKKRIKIGLAVAAMTLGLYAGGAKAVAQDYKAGMTTDSIVQEEEKTNFVYDSENRCIIGYDERCEEVIEEPEPEIKPIELEEVEPPKEPKKGFLKRIIDFIIGLFS